MAQNVCLSTVYEGPKLALKDGLGARMYSVQKCRLYKSQMSESRGLPVLCLVTLKINKCETVTLKSLFVRCVQLKHICGTVLAL
jgi:hypothetical protein